MVNEVGHCMSCNIQWVIRGDSDKKACPFCNAPEDEIWIEDETNEQDR